MKTRVMRSRVMIIGVLAAALGLAGCQTGGKGAQIGGALGAGAGCAVGAAAAKNNRAAGCLVGGIFGGIAGAIIGDAIEKRNKERVVYQAARSGGRASSGTFRNSRGERVRYTARVTKTYNQTFDSGLQCRSVAIDKSVNGRSAGSSSDSYCQARVNGKPTWPAPDA